MRTATPIDAIRGRRGLRRWENEDVVPRPDDALQERLYCIRWVDPETGEKCYRAPTEADLKREAEVLRLLKERLRDWQAKGFIPCRKIEMGAPKRMSRFAHAAGPAGITSTIHGSC